MTNDEIRKLLGGYATNTLTETERKALFDAALEDQDLFDALHQEQALKDLLADPASRAQIRQALEKPRAAWWSRWWTWTAAASAVAAAVLVVAVTRSHTPEPIQQYASAQAAKPAAEPPAEKVETDVKSVPQPASARMVREARASAQKQVIRARPVGSPMERKDELQSTTLPAPAVAPAAPPAPPPAALTASQQQVQVSGVPSQGRASDTQAQSQQVAGQTVSPVRDQEQSQAAPAQLNGAMGGVISKADFPPVQYTLLRRASDGTYQPLSAGASIETGDAIRLRVTAMTSGYLSLTRQDASGEWKRVFPQAGPGLAVSVNVHYTIPDSPIEVTGRDQRLRLTLAPAFNFDSGFASQAKAKVAPLKKESPANMPFVVDIIIGPNKVP
jgi:hypothetical protein